MLRRTVPLAAVAAGLALVLAGAGTPPENPQGQFQHKQHAALKLKCNYCHSGAAAEDQAGFPASGKQCKACHTAIEARKLPSARVYRVRDFVIFSHARHVSANLDCSSCHGEVYQADVLKVERPLTMIACLNCHKEQKATIVCTACHELGQ